MLGALLMALPAPAYDWLQYNGNAAHSGNNVLEKSITRSNVATMTQKFQTTLPGVADGAPVLLRRVATASGVRDLLFVTTTAGELVAVDARAGGVVWNKPHGPGTCKINNGGSTCFTTSSPAVDPNRQYVYSYGLDGYAHKHQVGDGTEILTGGWPQLTTTKGYDEKGSSALSFATSRGATYLYVAHGGYPGDNGDYQGHITAINLATGAQTVFNANCSDQPIHFNHVGMPPQCGTAQTAIWARPGVIYDAALDRIFMGTGNGQYNGNTAGKNWSESLIALNPDGTGASGKPLDAYTPTNFQSLDNADADLGSTAPAILPVPANSNVQRLAVQAGKDAKLRLVNLANMSGMGAPGHVGGEVGSIINLPQGGVVLSQPAVWVNPADGNTWSFIGNSNGISGLHLQVDGSGNPSLASPWQKSQGGFSPLVANNLLYYAIGGAVRALDPTSGSTLWTSSGIGGLHWQSPVVANGMVYVTDQSGKLTGFAPSYVPTFVDFNANGKTDLLWRNSAGGQTASWLMNGTAPTATAGLMNDPNWQVVAVADVNGDDKADLVWRNGVSGQTALWLMNGQVASAVAIVMADANWVVITTGDFNGDGKQDIVWRNSASGEIALWLMNGVAPSAAAVVFGDPNWSVVFTGDFDGDGKSDLLWRNNATGQSAIWLMNGLSASSSAIVYGIANWSVTATGDFDGDGKADLLWRNSVTGQTAIWLMNGLSTAAAAIVYADVNWSVTNTGDFNSDGTSDLVWHNNATGQTALWLMNGLSTAASAIVYADLNWSVTATGDLNGDGKADLIWHNTANGQTMAWLMNGLASSGNAIIFADPNWSVINPRH
ncbi:MAG: FG-GAP-like repeat-containing protein [Betaproteobacteria bacterium]